MTLPIFRPQESPGPSFVGLLRALGADPFARLEAAGGAPFEVRHGTTIAAIRYADGVIMAGDRRATAGSSIAHRTMDKVHPADRHSGVAIAGAAGPAMEMVGLFQLQLEHYEKVEGSALSLEGKANQLAQMVRANLAMAMQGFIVVPLFAGYDLRRGTGRIYTYDPTGGRYEETDFHADGSGGRDAAHHGEAGLAGGARPGGGHRARRVRPVAGGRRGHRHRRPRHPAGDLPDGRHHHRGGIRAGVGSRGRRPVRRRGRRRDGRGRDRVRSGSRSR